MKDIREQFFLVRQCMNELHGLVGTEFENDVFKFGNYREPFNKLDERNSEYRSEYESTFTYKPSNLTFAWYEYEDIGGWISSNRTVEFEEMIHAMSHILKSLGQ